ncbi:MAG: RNA polymerase sigma factor [Oscillospiraceae bacterium]|nr:RNA polymerase sigma factor [Oscillospiraceae bacterium]
MNDSDIVALYWSRDEAAVRETQQKYQGYLMKIACNILYNREDGQEAVNDTYMKAWNAMPPHKPDLLSVFLGRITRQLSIDRWRGMTREKRGGGEFSLSLDELSDVVSGQDDAERSFEMSQLSECIGTYLRGISAEKRDVFLWRYYFCDPIRDIAARRGESEAKIKSMLFRVREGLKQHLEKEGFAL